MAFDDIPEDREPPWLEELDQKFRWVMDNNCVAYAAYKGAKHYGMSEEFRLKAVIVQLVTANENLVQALSSLERI